MRAGRKRKSDGEVLLPPAAVDQAFVAVTHVSDGWDVDFGISVPAKASGVFKIPILMNVDPRGIYNYRTGLFLMVFMLARMKVYNAKPTNLEDSTVAWLSF